MKQKPYSYVVLQYRHDVWVGEALNVGVFLHCRDARFFGFKHRTGAGRLTQAYPDLEHSSLRDSLKSFSRSIDRLGRESELLQPEGNALEIGRKFLRNNDSSLAWGVTGTGVTDDPGQLLDRIYKRFVARYDQAASRDARTDAEVYEAVRRKLETAQLLDRVEQHTVRSKFAEIQFDHAIKNGVWHVIQPVSFDSADKDRMLDKATKWAGKLQSIAECSNSVRPYFVTGQPQDRSLMPHYHRMQDLLRTCPLDPIVMDEEAAGSLVAKVAQHFA